MPHNEKGQEIVDQRPVAMPVGYKKPEPLADTIRRLIRVEASEEAMRNGQETFEEADDFDVGEDYDPTSPYEMDFDQEVYQNQNPTFREENPTESKKNNMISKEKDKKQLESKGLSKKTSSEVKEEESDAPEGGQDVA